MILPINTKLLFGLGNPGEDYEDTFHNAGRLFINWLLAGKPMESEKNFEYFYFGKLILAVPLTFMNESGSAAREALKKFKLQPEELLLTQDDSDILLGNFKLSLESGSAGHKGVESVQSALGTEKISRLRFGVRSQNGKAGDWVLNHMSPKERELLYGAFEGAKLKVIEKLNP